MLCYECKHDIPHAMHDGLCEQCADDIAAQRWARQIKAEADKRFIALNHGRKLQEELDEEARRNSPEA